MKRADSTVAALQKTKKECGEEGAKYGVCVEREREREGEGASSLSHKWRYEVGGRGTTPPPSWPNIPLLFRMRLGEQLVDQPSCVYMQI